ncbi:hypothetical protein EK904_007010 [Melospiza melodia maxima]|nr:hypothetical protein EK904_007010 [Melospiza melodia maxima]
MPTRCRVDMEIAMKRIASLNAVFISTKPAKLILYGSSEYNLPCSLLPEDREECAPSTAAESPRAPVILCSCTSEKSPGSGN